MTTGRIRSIIIYIVCLEKNQSSFERILAKFQSISPTAAVILKELQLHGVKIVMKAKIFQKKDHKQYFKS